jgi:hypothetical protein
MSDVDHLYSLQQEAHANSALANDNLSSAFVINMARVGKSYTEAIATAILSLGNIHGPVKEAREILYRTDNSDIESALDSGLLIPGFGNAFYKDGIDPAWNKYEKELKLNWKEHADRIEAVRELIKTKKQIEIFPNPAAFTAVVAELLDVAPGTEISLAISARIVAWNVQWADNQ